MASRKKPAAKTAVQPARQRTPQTTPLRITYTPFGAVERLGYRAAEVIRKSGRVQPSSGSGDYQARWDLKLLRAESQRFDRDNGLYTGTVNRLLDNILGDGFRLQARTANKRTNARLEELWCEWGKECEVRGLDDWYDIERMVGRHIIVDGDAAALKLDAGTLQLIEAERIDYPATQIGKSRVENGVELDPVGRPVAFHICNYRPDGTVDSKGMRYTADNVIFIAARNRISQTRGMPLMVPSFPMFHRINDVCDSEAVAWQLLSRLAVAINRKDAAELADLTSTAGDDTTPPSMASRYHDIGDAIIFNGEPGETVQGIERTLPGADFPESIKAFMRLLGLPIGFPLELMLLDWSNTNYSSARAALLQAYRMLTRWQRMLMRSFHTPVYEWKVKQWVEAGLIRPSDDVLEHDWFPPPFPWIEPLKDAEANALLVDRGYSTYAEVLKGQNRDRVDMIDQRALEIREAIATAKAIEEETGEKVPWQLFAGYEAAAASADPQAAPTGGIDPEVESLKQRLDAYGVGVRAGSITPQTDDENEFRQTLGLPAMSEDAKRAWSEDKGTRRPITLTPPAGAEPAAPVGPKPPEKPEDEPPQDEEPEAPDDE